ncbi:hypothetical protein RQN30_02215 [Arcanobacterium hippocoleae]
MDVSQLDSVSQTALAQIRVVLSEIAPEIPENEILPAANLFQDLGLDLVSKWALAVELEKITKSELLDKQITAAVTVADFMGLISSSAVTQKLAQQNNQIANNTDAKKTHSTDAKIMREKIPDAADGESSTKLATAADLAALLG